MSQSIYYSLTLSSLPGRRLETLQLAGEIERRGFDGVFCAQSGAGMALCHSLAHTTTTLRFGTGIVNIYGRNPVELSQSACYLNEVSDGRFTLGLGVSHQPFNEALGVEPGKPVPDMRNYLERLRGAAEQFGGLPPVYLAALRKRMATLAGKTADGALFANMPFSRIAETIGPIPQARRDAGFWVGNIIPICVAEERAAAIAAMKQRELIYAGLPYYLDFWREGGYTEQIDRLEHAFKQSGPEAATEAMDERWLSDVSIVGTPSEARERVAAWQAAGVTPVLGPVSLTSDPFEGFVAVMDALK